MLRFGKAIGLKQICNQLGTMREVKSFLRGAIFKTMFNSFGLCPTHFPGGKKFSKGVSHP